MRNRPGKIGIASAADCCAGGCRQAHRHRVAKFPTATRNAAVSGRYSQQSGKPRCDRRQSREKDFWPGVAWCRRRKPFFLRRELLKWIVLRGIKGRTLTGAVHVSGHHRMARLFSRPLCVPGPCGCRRRCHTAGRPVARVGPAAGQAMMVARRRPATASPSAVQVRCKARPTAPWHHVTTIRRVSTDHRRTSLTKRV